MRAQIEVKINAEDRFEAGDILMENIKENGDLKILQIIYDD